MALDYASSYAAVKARVKAAGSSFSAGMTILPRERREAMFGLYAFCREVDDIADESPTLEIAREGLTIWRKKIKDLFNGAEPDHAITRVIQPAIKKFGLKEKDFQDVIDGMQMDAENVICAPTEKDLDLYCDRVASAVGRSSVRIFGDGTEKGMKVAHHLGRALQLTNILRDIAEDAGRGRIYLPEERLERYGCATRDASKILEDPALAVICHDIATTAHDHYAQTYDAMNQCKKGSMRSARIMAAYYGAILDRLEEQKWEDPYERVRLTKGQKISLILKNLF